jgi:hypothetical protein
VGHAIFLISGYVRGIMRFVDAPLAREEALVFQAGNHREAVRVRFSDFERLVHPTVGDFCSYRGDVVPFRESRAYLLVMGGRKCCSRIEEPGS